jgi:chromosome segregation ATPase
VANGKSGGNNLNGVLTPVIAAVSLAASIGVAFWTNSKGDVASVKQELREDIRNSEDRVMREIGVLRELIQTKVVYKDEYREFMFRVDKLNDIYKDQIKAMQADLVPRSEHMQHWAEFTDRLNALNISLQQERQERSSSINDMRKEFGGTYTASDQLKNLQDQIKQLNGRLDAFQRPPNAATVTPTPSATRMSGAANVPHLMRIDDH